MTMGKMEEALESYKRACEPALRAVNARLAATGVPDWDVYEDSTSEARAAYEAALREAEASGEDVEGYR